MHRFLFPHDVMLSVSCVINIFLAMYHALLVSEIINYFITSRKSSAEAGGGWRERERVEICLLEANLRLFFVALGMLIGWIESLHFRRQHKLSQSFPANFFRFSKTVFFLSSSEQDMEHCKDFSLLPSLHQWRDVGTEQECVNRVNFWSPWRWFFVKTGSWRTQNAGWETWDGMKRNTIGTSNHVTQLQQIFEGKKYFPALKEIVLSY